jgi:hypothetical protein
MLNKAIQHGKEHREPYRRPKDIDRSCRNHGSCTRCESDRKHANNKKLLSAEEALKEVEEIE